MQRSNGRRPRAFTTVGRREVTPASRMNGASLAGQRALPILIRHSRSGVPSFPIPIGHV